MYRFLFYICVMTLAASFLCGCGEKRLPVDAIKSELRDVPTFSIILDDMDERGTFSKTHYHKYRILQEGQSWTTDWIKVPKDYYKRYETFLGMTLASKKEGQHNDTAGPAGYNYVGDSNYGRWQRDSSGNSFWAFYGQYRLLSDLLGGSRIYRRDYSTYQQYNRQNRPYFGRNNEYGTKGSVTKRQKPNFYSRREAKVRTSKASFSDRVNNRIGRTRTSVRSRSYGRGK